MRRIRLTEWFCLLGIDINYYTTLEKFLDSFPIRGPQNHRQLRSYKLSYIISIISRYQQYTNIICTYTPIKYLFHFLVNNNLA